MTQEDARAYLNYLLTLHLRQEEAFGPLGLAFIKENDLTKLSLLPEEQFNLLMAIATVFSAEPKRYTVKLELLQKAYQLLPQTRYNDPELGRDLEHLIRKTQSDLHRYNEAMKVARSQSPDRQSLIVETDIPEYFLETAQKRASTYYQEKYRLTKEAKTAQHFGGAAKKFEPDNPAIQKEFPGACAPFINARTNAFHIVLPFDLKISRSPEDPLEAGIRIFYGKMGYSFPLRYEMGKLCSYHDGQVLDVDLRDPNLIFFSVSGIKDPEFIIQASQNNPSLPPELVYPMAVLEHTGSLGPFIQVSCNIKVWFDASMVSLLIQGAPDLPDYGLQGGAGLMTRTYASDKVESYVHNLSQPWQEGLSFNFVNLHLQLSRGIDSAVIPFGTPIFSVYPVFNRQSYRVVDRRTIDQAS
ncbi:MAG: hypothetical protein MRJ67_12525 [Nitrospirales bacterium]|nr:hypothetical protein [Nitrospirales bacterium]MDR4482457.1 hypothetical protein [Nitrospirales bacterium]